MKVDMSDLKLENFKAKISYKTPSSNINIQCVKPMGLLQSAVITCFHNQHSNEQIREFVESMLAMRDTQEE
ncbi:MAG: hypothetical protein V3W52_17150 [Syntrophobacteria bacterium]